ncbi:MAG: hypothetical protein WCS85_02330 [Candidatus Peribacteraceae bacterium]
MNPPLGKLGMTLPCHGLSHDAVIEESSVPVVGFFRGFPNRRTESFDLLRIHIF